MVYVRKSCRRSGVGKRLLERAGKKYGPMSVIGWDFNSNSFFARLSNRDIMIIDKDQVK
jgi:GNAT superfamily N-acetyltransferase